MAASSKALEGFQRVSKRVYRFDPAEDKTWQSGDAITTTTTTQKIPSSTTTEATREGSPTTIMIFGWADASPRHLAKFTDGYRRMYPRSKIVLVTAETMATFFGSQEAAKAHVRDIVAEIFRGEEERVLIHAFSNSGGINLEAACLAYHDQTASASPLPASGVIFDSTPGGSLFWNEFPRWSRGVYAGLAPVVPLPGFMLMAFSWTWVLLVMGIPMLFGNENIASRVSRFVNDPKNISKGAERLYLYSKADPLIGWRDVEGQAADASEKGFVVHLERFEDSVHCAHMRMYPEIYWSAVAEFWKGCC